MLVAAPPALMAAIRKICNEHGIVMIADEVQTGFARTGKLFAMEHYPLADMADLVTVAKGLGGGLPIAAVVGRASIMDSAGPGGLGGTFAGNPVGIAAAHAVLDVIKEEKLCERAETLGARLRKRLEDMRSHTPQIADVRGLGLMSAVEFTTARGGKTWNPTFTAHVREEALRKGLILLTCGVHGNIIRFLCPLTIPDEHFNEAMDILEASIKFAQAAEVEAERAAEKKSIEDKAAKDKAIEEKMTEDKV